MRIDDPANTIFPAPLYDKLPVFTGSFVLRK